MTNRIVALKPENVDLSLIKSVTDQSEITDTYALYLDDESHSFEGMAEKIVAPGFPPLPDLIEAFLEEGGEIEICSNSAEFRGLTEEMFRDDRIVIAGAAKMVDDVLNYDSQLTF